MRKTTKNPLNKHPIIIVIMVLLAIYALSMLVVLAWGLMISFKNYPMDINGLNNPVPDFLSFPSLQFSRGEMFNFWNYQRVFENVTAFKHKVSYYSAGVLQTPSVMGNYLTYIYNTILYTGVGTLILSVVPAIGAYMCAKYKCMFSKIQTTVYLLFMMIPIVGSYPAELTFLRNTGMYNTFWGNWIQKLHFSGMYFFVYLAFYEGLSDAYAEAAEIDGASQWNILIHIVLPLSAKMIGSVALIQFITLWNDYQTPQLYLPTHPTLAYATFLFTQPAMTSGGRYNGNVSVEIAACMLLALPILIIYIAFNKKVLGDISMGGIKG